MSAANPFFCFLKSYRDQCNTGAATKSQKLLAEEAGQLWRNMTAEQRCPYVRMAQHNKRVVNTPFSSGEESAEDEEPADKILTSERYQRELAAEKKRLKRHACSTTRCIHEPSSPDRMPIPEQTPVNSSEKTRVQKLLDCLFCRCEKGEYARGLLFELGRRANDYLPDMEDEQFFVYYKVLITTLVGMGVFTLLLSLWHHFN